MSVRLGLMRSKFLPILRRLSLRARLALGFGLITLLFVGANYWNQQTSSAVTEQLRHAVAKKEYLDRLAEPMLEALAVYQLKLSSPELISPAAFASASRALTQAAEAYREFDTLDGSRLALDQSLADIHADLADIEVERSRGTQSLSRFWKAFETLDAEFATKTKGAWRVGDRVFIRESMTSAAEALLLVRQTVTAYLASPSARRWSAIVSAQQNFESVLDHHSSVLIQQRNEAWLEAVRRKFASLSGQLQSLRVADQNMSSKVATASGRIHSLSTAIREQISAPAAQMLIATTRDAAALAERASERVAMASAVILAMMLLIALLTVISITRPIGRLARTTQEFADGNQMVRARRGNMLELDRLAAAFNDMAQRLAKANQVMRADQARLEDRVADRTQQLEYLAYHDALTHLPNRRHLFRHLTSLLEQATAEGQRVALLLIDLDNFKTLNDSQGHLFGDSVLQAVSDRLLDVVDGQGFAARLGGDEFTTVWPLTGDVERLTERVAKAFESPLRVGDREVLIREVLISVSIGASLFPDHGTAGEDLVRAADAALFRAKSEGRNRTCVASPALLEQMASQFKIEQALRRAVHMSELELMFQPQLSLATGKVNCVEALLRWRRDNGYVMPMEFLPVAEQSGLIGDITDWVLGQSVTTLSHWRRGAWPEARVAVNISAQQFLDPDFVQKLQTLLVKHDLPPESLELELTETVLQSGLATVSTLRELRKLGVGIALDDFGAGYSSLASIEQLQLSRVKIDRSLVENIDTHTRSADIARSMISLCHSLQLEVTVEGIERLSQLHVLRGCEHVDVQGYLFAEPLPTYQVPGACIDLTSRLSQLIAIDTANGDRAPATILQWRGPTRPRS